MSTLDHTTPTGGASETGAVPARQVQSPVPVSPAGTAGTAPARRSKRLTGWLTTLVVTVIAVVVVVPWLNAIWVSFKTDAELSDDPISLRFAPTLTHYANALGAAGYDFPRFFLNSALIAVGTVALVLLIAIPSTYAAIRLGFGGNFIMNASSGLRLLPAIFFAVPFFLLMSNLGLLDTIPGLVLANTFLNLPLGIILLAAGFRDVPTEIEEAAQVDGASTYRILTSVLIPVLTNSIVAVAVLVFIFTWNDYLFALVLSSSNATPITLGAANFVTSTGIRWGDISATTVLSTLPPILFAVFAQRYLVSGLSSGAVKG